MFVGNSTGSAFSIWEMLNCADRFLAVAQRPLWQMPKGMLKVARERHGDRDGVKGRKIVFVFLCRKMVCMLGISCFF